MLRLVLAVTLLAAVTADCSSGDTAYVCANLNRCWGDLGFSNSDELKYLCDLQGLPTNGGGGGGGGGGNSGPAVITSPPRNVTIPRGASAQFSCSADNAMRVKIVPRDEYAAELIEDFGDVSPTSQKVINAIDEAYEQHIGWYICVAYGADGSSVSAEAYLDIRDICANHDCLSPKTCEPDMYTGTYECVCPSDCPKTFEPVCGSDCQSYFNECSMLKEACERGLVGVTVASRGQCTFSPSTPFFTNTPPSGTFPGGQTQTFSAAAEASPNDITYQWYFGNRLLGEGQSFTTQLKASQTGEWVVKASVCHGQYQVEHRYSVVVQGGGGEADERQCCDVYGDPHLLTFDSTRYDYMGACTYVLAQDDVKGQWLVYGTFKACGDKTKQLSCIVSITVFFESEMVQFLRMYRVNYNGDEFMVPIGDTRYLGDIKIENRAMKYFISLGDTGVEVSWDGITTSKICLPDKCAGGVSGMCASADCDPTNDYFPYTSSSAFGNSWAVGDGCELEPEDGSLSVERTRPCDFVSQEESFEFEARCSMMLDLDAFVDCIDGMGLDRSALIANCMFDMCAGLSMGGNCKGDGDQRCDAEIEAKIVRAMAMEGMTRSEAEAMYKPVILDPACMMALDLEKRCSGSGWWIGDEWREGAVCPSDAALSNMRVCP